MLTRSISRTGQESWFGRHGMSSEQLKERLFYFFVALTVVDGMQTTAVVTWFGSETEVNPLMKWMLTDFGINGLWWGKAFTVFAVLLVYEKLRPKILLAGALILGFVVCSNLLQMMFVSGQ